ncbi:MAG: 5'-nucleotidase C-terminal domain-containing protein [Chitinophagaceae bacterium]|nr:5'-nucleotidase C-terminal domain-containing protein [Chitinophagaceae bacterium]
MKKNFSFIYFIIFLVCTGLSCNTSFRTQSLHYNKYSINDALAKDSSLLIFLQPYSNQVNKTMNEVVGIADMSLDKKQPECTLGNFMTDAFLAMAREKYATTVDLALVNFGGLRLNELPAGDVTNGKIFELMPFDNLLILQKVRGDILQQFLDLTAARGGWPVAGMTMQIKDKKAVHVLIGGTPLNPDVIYTIANSDFIANGGDNADMLRNIPQITNGYLMRDALFDYIKLLKSQGSNISANLENRVTHAK